VGRCEGLSMRTSMRPSVYTLTDRQLADEYKKLTGACLEVPSRRDRVHWRRWRDTLQLRLLEERVAHHTW
jgi:hypothetical protein